MSPLKFELSQEWVAVYVAEFVDVSNLIPTIKNMTAIPRVLTSASTLKG